MVIQAAMSFMYLFQLDCDKYHINSFKAIIACASFNMIVLGLLGVVFMLYWCRLRKHNESMIAFHIFLACYRHTPKSKNITKYLPPQDAIYEEASQFERSQWDASSSSHKDHLSTIRLQKNQNLPQVDENRSVSMSSVSNSMMSKVAASSGHHASFIAFNPL